MQMGTPDKSSLMVEDGPVEDDVAGTLGQRKNQSNHLPAIVSTIFVGILIVLFFSTKGGSLFSAESENIPSESVVIQTTEFSSASIAGLSVNAQSIFGEMSFASTVREGVSVEDMKGSLNSKDPCEGEKFKGAKKKCPPVKFESLPKALKEEGWELGKLVGHGSFGHVYYLKHGKSGDRAALKVAIPSDSNRKLGNGTFYGKNVKGGKGWLHADKILEEESQTFQGIASVSSSFVCKMFSEFRVQVEIPNENGDPVTKFPRALVLNWYDGSLEKLAKDHMQHDLLYYYMFQLIMGLRDFHRAGYAHMDLKQENFLYKQINGKNPRVAICDVGLSKKLSSRTSIPCSGTFGYKAPEVELCSCSVGRRACCGSKVDVKTCKNQTGIEGNEEEIQSNCEKTKDFCKTSQTFETSVDVWSLGSVFLRMLQMKKKVCWTPMFITSWKHAKVNCDTCESEDQKQMCKKKPKSWSLKHFQQVSDDVKGLVEADNDLSESDKRVLELIGRMLEPVREKRITTEDLETKWGLFLQSRWEAGTKSGDNIRQMENWRQDQLNKPAKLTSIDESS